LGRSWPSRDWADLGPTKSPIFVWVGPGQNSRDGPESVWPTKHMAGPEPVWPREENTNNAGPESA